MILLANPEIWLVCGSQHLYGPGPLKQVAADAEQIAAGLAKSKKLPLKTVFKALLTTPDEIAKLCLEANSDPNCAGLILWMHTFSPSKMWIRGLNVLQKPFAHLHTQFNAELPWDTIDMDFMNLNQSAHGDREAGFIHTRMRLARKVVVGHWADPEVHDRLGAWMRAARAWHDWQGGEVLPLRRQHAPGRGDRGRQGRRGNAPSASRPTATASAIWSPRSTRSATPPRPSSPPNTRRATRSFPICARAASATSRCSTAPSRSSACAPSSRRAASRASPTRSRTCTASSNCRASRRSG